MEMTYTEIEGHIIERSEMCKTCEKDERNIAAWCKCAEPRQGTFTRCNYGNCCGYICGECGEWC